MVKGKVMTRTWVLPLIFIGISLMFQGVSGRVVDLSHRLNNRSVHFQLYRDFKLETVIKGFQPRFGLWVETNDIVLSEHTGTHIDAPRHTWETGIYMHQIQAVNLIGPAVVISVVEQGKGDPDYALSVADLRAFEEEYGPIPYGAIVCLYTGGAHNYWNQPIYLGTKTPNNYTTMHFQGFSGPAVSWLIDERGIKGIGADRMSFDPGQNVNFPAHIALLSKGKFGIENMNNLHKLPSRGATIIVGALPIEGGSGAPARVTAVWGTDSIMGGRASANEAAKFVIVLLVLSVAVMITG